MVPVYLDFEDLVKIEQSQSENRLSTLSDCGGLQVDSQLDPNKLVLKDATGEDLLIDRRD